MTREEGVTDKMIAIALLDIGVLNHDMVDTHINQEEEEQVATTIVRREEIQDTIRYYKRFLQLNNVLYHKQKFLAAFFIDALCDNYING